jgi:hypothetical protein
MEYDETNDHERSRFYHALSIPESLLAVRKDITLLANLNGKVSNI